MNAQTLTLTPLEWDVLHWGLQEHITGFQDAEALFVAIAKIASTGGDVCWLAEMGRRLALAQIERLETQVERLTDLLGVPASVAANVAAGTEGARHV